MAVIRSVVLLFFAGTEFLSIQVSAVSAEVYLNQLKHKNVCKYEKHPDAHDDTLLNLEPLSLQNITLADTVDGFTVQCKQPYHYCQVFWRFDPDDENKTEVILKGCWNGHSQDCEQNECVAYTNVSSPLLANTRWCCCLGSMCNDYFAYRYDPVKSNLRSRPTNFAASAEKMAYLDMGLLIFVALIVVLALGSLIFVCCKHVKTTKNIGGKRNCQFRCHNEGGKLLPVDSMTDGTTNEEMGGNFIASVDKSVKNIDFSSITLLDLINKGRYGSVYKAISTSKDGGVNESKTELAVKIYKGDCFKYYWAEKTTFQLPNMTHDNLLTFFGSKEMDSVAPKENKLAAENEDDVNCERSNNDAESRFVQREFWLVTEFMNRGPLHEFLKGNSTDWIGFLRMAYSMANGLAYLHFPLSNERGQKPPIAHRDINSRNILLKNDGSCLICDFGFSMILDEENLKSSNRMNEGVTLPEVGTVRYMAPEVLEGAVNLRDPETALKQVDVYALGLVFWEILSRCEEIYELTGHTVPEYSPPYSAEIAMHPTLEEMQSYVCRKKVRPVFPYAVYKFNQPTLRSLRELIEDCWDQDSEARITALCARERISEMAALNPYLLRTSSHTATHNLPENAAYTNTMQPEFILPPSNSLTCSTSANSTGYGSLREPGGSDRDIAALPFSGENSAKIKGFTNPSGVRDDSNLVGIRNLRPLRLIAGFSVPAGFGNSYSPPMIPVQPYQGRNPCQERNILGFLHHQDSSEDSSSDLMSRRVVESAFKDKIDPCSPETLARFLIGGKEKLTNQLRGEAERKGRVEPLPRELPEKPVFEPRERLAAACEPAGSSAASLPCGSGGGAIGERRWEGPGESEEGSKERIGVAGNGGKMSGSQTELNGESVRFFVAEEGAVPVE